MGDMAVKIFWLILKSIGFFICQLGSNNPYLKHFHPLLSPFIVDL